MMIRRIAAVAALVLISGALAPMVSASAADATLTGVLSGTSGPEPGLVIGWVEADDFTNFETESSGESGEYTLEIPADIGDFFLFTNLSLHANGSGDALDADYTGEFFGDGSDRDFLVSRVTPFSLPISGPLDITLTAAGSISGTAPDYGGQDLALVTLGGTPVDVATVDDDGVFAIDALYPGKYRITAVGPGLTNYSSPAITVSAGEVSELAVEPQPSASVSGIVRNGSTPLRKIFVELYSVIDSDFAVEAVETDSTGHYSFGDVQPGDYRMVLTSFPKSASRSFVSETVLISDVAAAEDRTVDVRLAAAGLITGKVRKTADADYYSVRAYDSAGRFAGDTYGTMSGQRFWIGGLRAGRYTVHFTDNDEKRYDTRTVTVRTRKTSDVGTRSLTKRTATLTGSVSGASGGFVTVSLGGSGIDETAIGSSGKYRIRGLVPSTFTVSTIARDTEKRSIRLKIAASRSKILTPGAPFGTYTGTAKVEDLAVQGFGGYETRASGYSPFEIVNGAFRGTGRAGEAKLVNFQPVDVPLPPRSPYWYTAPPQVRTITLTSGETTALGVFELELHGVSESR